MYFIRWVGNFTDEKSSSTVWGFWFIVTFWWWCINLCHYLMMMHTSRCFRYSLISCVWVFQKVSFLKSILKHTSTCFCFQVQWQYKLDTSVIAGYGNEEEVPLKILQPSQGQAARKMQEAAAAQDMQEQLVRPVVFGIFLADWPWNIL